MIQFFIIYICTLKVVTSVTSVDPVQDFQTLLSKGVPLESLSNQIEKVLFSLLRASTGGQMVEKIVGCIRTYRQASVDLKKPSAYNDFIKEAKVLFYFHRHFLATATVLIYIAFLTFYQIYSLLNSA